MAKISTYATVAPTSTDKVIGTDTDNSSATKNFTIQGIADFAALGGYVYPRYNYVTSPAATSTAVVGDYIFITVDTHVCTLPTAVGVAGKTIGVIVTVAPNTGISVNVIPTGAETINGVAIQYLAAQFASYTFISDGADWFIAN